MRRRGILFCVALVIAMTGTAAFAASLTFTVKHLAAGNLTLPVFYPNNISTTNSGTVRKPTQNDTLTIVYSAELQESTLCAGAPNTIGTQSIPIAVVNIANNTGSTGNDVLSMGAISTAACSDGQLHFGSVDLGAAGYVTSGTATFTNSMFAVTQTTTSCTIVITLGNPAGALAQVASGSPAVYTPDPALTDASGHSVGVSTAITTTTTVF